ncbi:MAG: cytochrome c oxidase assembly protein [Methylobacter sp.]|uniref:Cytochrome c oxidase assembly protein CtaG n=1 Tax=Candidatus Methylobacter titanis TaxID=3053457 RepID=A0AA43Q3K4_9GAMM|nr:cytochrome c oxidase assembly protein [Candidatus Methylobacter titanis]MDI1292643.1 cytochrome c oxidase assembly protein [Candidatus Methylobacter titanis]
MSKDVANKNIKLARTLLLVAVAMFGFGYALVPLYDVLCEWKWIERDRPDDIKKVPEVAYQIDRNREVTVEFMTTLNESTPMKFRAEKKQLKVHPGEYYTVNFYAENKTDNAMVARAIPSFSPAVISSYFEKIECFCFSEQTFKAKEAKIMPMRFVINPALPEQYKTITLSYTFFDNTEKSVKK